MTQQRPAMYAGQALAEEPARPLARALYIHIPFCFHKCHYCDFYSIVDTRDRQEAFVARLESELRALAPWAGPISTIFVGGGTPSLLRPALWDRLLHTLAAVFDLSPIAEGGEFTVECNPETVTPELMAILKQGGVTRASIGAQSFNNRHLKTLERWHDPANVERAVTMAREAGIFRQSIDLIFAVPGQTLDDWVQDLNNAISLGTEHLSCYALTYEPGTAMTARLYRGEFPRADEDLEADMFAATLSLLRDAGLDRYEVSNFARPGGECRHNLAYWRQENWLAAGPAASAHLAGRRWKNVPRLDDYLGPSPDGTSPIIDFEGRDPRRALSERIMTGLRLREGINRSSVLAQAREIDPQAPERLDAAAADAIAQGLLAPDGWSLTDAGFLVADRVVLDFMTALDP